ncbi:Ectonucleoside triphosphate diphosphohydrolase 1 [Hypsibius exemplaris]|uniref:Ectonucleoside triphosphate diphosphohydrolase 1 n=1 Tax=Hypsibius exemplaris TaxID=2072580 RepID=A0A1W0X1W8_HYPEX|nr:Ectonucleoside triphosphate diphosphohydrolase 1 [Hypsibius exemplaris]
MSLDSRNRYAWVLCVFTILVVVGGLLGTLFFHYHKSDPDVGIPVTTSSYLVILDAGSTHTAVFVYRWFNHTENAKNGTLQVQQLASQYCETKGLSNYPNHEHVGVKLKKCLNYATEHVPREVENSTEIHLGGTAGLRLLQSENSSAFNAVMKAVKREIQLASGFVMHPHNIRIITGEEEGLYGWASANYLEDAFLRNVTHQQNKTDEFNLYGVLQLGGASTQITFQPAASIGATNRVHYNVTAELFGEAVQLYSRSFLCHGLKEADRAYKAMLVEEQDSPIVFDPCLPAGRETWKTYDQLFGRYCTSQYKTRLRDNKCSFNGGDRKPQLNGQFLAFSGYFYTLRYLSLVAKNNDSAQDTASLSAFRNATRRHCNKTWLQLNKRNYTSNEKKLMTLFCFNAHYIETILTSGYGFTEGTFRNIKFWNDIRGTEFGWALGYALNVTLSKNPLHQQRPHVQNLHFVDGNSTEVLT